MPLAAPPPVPADNRRTISRWALERASNSEVTATTHYAHDPTVPDRQGQLMAQHSAGSKEHHLVGRYAQLACEAIQAYYIRDEEVDQTESQN